MATLGHVGQQADLVFDRAICSHHIAPARTSHFTPRKPAQWVSSSMARLRAAWQRVSV